MKKILLGLTVFLIMSCSHGEDRVIITKEIVTESANNQLNLPNFVSLVREVGNTVVNITVTNTPENPPQFLGIDPRDPMAELFKKFIPEEQRSRIASGSGFIIASDGYILTNAHVVMNAAKIIVKTMGQQEYSAKLIGTDPKTDIALLKVNANNLPAVKIGDPDKLKVGEWVAAIGAPFGFDNTVTQGIVSAKGRNLPSETYVPFIQTDVPINPGNSGGPLFNLNGEVVGINSQIYSRSGGYMGISFSIPIDIAMNISQQLRAHGKVNHALLGVQVQALNNDLAKSFGLKNNNGALVASVSPNSAAAKAGILVGDIILQVDTKMISNSSELPFIIGSKSPNSKVILTIYRSAKVIQVPVILQANIDNTTAANPEDNNSKTEQVILKKFGLTLYNLPSDSQEKFGVMVARTEGVAAMAGIQVQDIILSIDNKKINNIKQVAPIVANKNIIALLLSREGRQIFVSLRVD